MVNYEVVVNYCPSLVPRACCLYGNCVLTSFEYLSILLCFAAWLAAVPGAATEWDNAKVSGTVRYQVKGFRRPKAETSCDWDIIFCATILGPPATQPHAYQCAWLQPSFIG